MPGKVIVSGGSLGSVVEISELESLADGVIPIGDGSGAPTTLAAFSSSAGTTLIVGADALLTRKAAATLHHGAADAASPVAQIVGAQGSRGGTDTDVAGAGFTIRSGIGTGAAAASSVIFQTPTVGASSSTAQTMATRLTVATAAITATVPYVAPLGLVSAPGLAWTGFLSSGIYGSGGGTIVSVVGTATLLIGGGIVALPSLAPLAWASTNAATGTADAGIGRNAAGVVEVNNGTLGTLRDITVRSVFATNLGATTNLRALRSVLVGAGNLLATSDTAYWVYLGMTTEALTVKHVEFAVTTGGGGTQAAEIALASSPLAPNKAGQTLTKIAADATLSDLTGTGMMRNTTTLAQAVPAGTHLWAGIRAAMSITQPTTTGLLKDYSQGHVLSTATAGALTGAGPWTGALIAHATATAQAPDLSIVID